MPVVKWARGAPPDARSLRRRVGRGPYHTHSALPRRCSLGSRSHARGSARCMDGGGRLADTATRRCACSAGGVAGDGAAVAGIALVCPDRSGTMDGARHCAGATSRTSYVRLSRNRRGAVCVARATVRRPSAGPGLRGAGLAPGIATLRRSVGRCHRRGDAYGPRLLAGSRPRCRTCSVGRVADAIVSVHARLRMPSYGAPLR